MADVCLNEVSNWTTKVALVKKFLNEWKMADTNFFLITKTQIPEFESFKYLFRNLTYIKRYVSIAQ